MQLDIANRGPSAQTKNWIWSAVPRSYISVIFDLFLQFFSFPALHVLSCIHLSSWLHPLMVQDGQEQLLTLSMALLRLCLGQAEQDQDLRPGGFLGSDSSLRSGLSTGKFVASPISSSPPEEGGLPHYSLARSQGQSQIVLDYNCTFQFKALLQAWDQVRRQVDICILHRRCLQPQ
jgi:hypothetical protein